VDWVAVENTDDVPLGTRHGLPPDNIRQNDDDQNILGILEAEMADRKSSRSVAGRHELAVGNSSKSVIDAESDATLVQSLST
jgi:hypothetical protein